MTSATTLSRALVTGGSGFVGGDVIRQLLAQDVQVAAVTRSPLPDAMVEEISWQGRVEELVDAAAAFSPDAVFHIAATGTADHEPADIAPLIDANVTLGVALLEGAAMTQKQASKQVPCVAVGSFWQRSAPLETFAPNSLYAATKEALADIATYYRMSQSVPFVQVLLSDVYGTGARRRRFLDYVADAVRSGETLDATSGTQIVSFVHVADAANGIIDAASVASVEHGGPYWISGSESESLRSTIEQVLADTGQSAEIRWGARPHRKEEVMTPYFGQRLPGWSPNIRLADGFLELIRDSRA